MAFLTIRLDSSLDLDYTSFEIMFSSMMSNILFKFYINLAKSLDSSCTDVDLIPDPKDNTNTVSCLSFACLFSRINRIFEL